MEQSLIYTRPAHLQQISTKERLRRNLDVRYGRLRVPGLVLTLVLRDVEGGERELYRRGTDTEAGARTAVLTPQLPHLLPPGLHQRLVLGDPELLAVHYAGPLGPRPVPATHQSAGASAVWAVSPVVGVLLHVQLGQLGLLLVEKLLLCVGHCLPS